MAKSVNTPKEETLVVAQVEETLTPAPVVEVVKEEVVTPVKPSVNKQEIVNKLGELASIFKNMYGEQLNPVFAEIHKSLSNAQYKIMQNL
jgi:hypothetical protein